MGSKAPRQLSELEAEVWRVLSEREPCTADDVRAALARKRPLKDSTVRTVLRRLEAKGYVTHSVDGRTYVYRRVAAARKVATRAVRQIVERFFGGSVEGLLVGMMADRMVSPEQLERLARRVDAESEAE